MAMENATAIIVSMVKRPITIINATPLFLLFMAIPPMRGHNAPPFRGMAAHQKKVDTCRDKKNTILWFFGPKTGVLGTSDLRKWTTPRQAD